MPLDSPFTWGPEREGESLRMYPDVPNIILDLGVRGGRARIRMMNKFERIAVVE
jgi:hypothetical protein